MATAIAGAGTWRLYVIGALIGAGGVCTLKAFRLKRRLGREGTGTEDPHQ